MTYMPKNFARDIARKSLGPQLTTLQKIAAGELTSPMRAALMPRVLPEVQLGLFRAYEHRMKTLGSFNTAGITSGLSAVEFSRGLSKPALAGLTRPNIGAAFRAQHLGLHAGLLEQLTTAARLAQEATRGPELVAKEVALSPGADAALSNLVRLLVDDLTDVTLRLVVIGRAVYGAHGNRAMIVTVVWSITLLQGLALAQNYPDAVDTFEGITTVGPFAAAHYMARLAGWIYDQTAARPHEDDDAA